MPLTIREATATDVPAILAIINHAIIHTTAVYDYEPRSLATQQAWFDQKQAAGMPVVVAEENGAVIGFGSYGIFRPWAGYRFSAEHSIYVAEPAQKKGVGRAMLTELIGRAKAQGFHTLIAGIDASNAGSQAFHRAFGFVEVGRFREVGYKFDTWLDLVFMQLFF